MKNGDRWVTPRDDFKEISNDLNVNMKVNFDNDENIILSKDNVPK